MSLSRLDLRRNRREPLLSFASHVRQQEGGSCWEWVGYRNRTGYGHCSPRQGGGLAHRFSYELHFGPIPPGFVVMHTCDNPPCVRPAHLVLGIQRLNVADRGQKGRTARGARHGSRTHSERWLRSRSLTEQQEREVRERYAAGEITQARLGAEYGVHFTTIGRVVRRAEVQP